MIKTFTEQGVDQYSEYHHSENCNDYFIKCLKEERLQNHYNDHHILRKPQKCVSLNNKLDGSH